MCVGTRKERMGKMAEFHFSPRENKAHLINWHSWGEDAFRKAEEQNKLILLSIGAVWCHWCHVMDEQAYSDSGNIQLINERFIPIRVDTDRQPDVNRRYNMGGWPTTVVLTSDGELLQGGTYIPSVGLNKLLTELDSIYHENSEEIKQRVQTFYRQHQSEIDQRGEADLKEEMILEVRSMVLEEYEPEYGGFGIEPKFPHTEALNFLLDEYYRTQNEDLAEVLHKTLTNMAGGGMFDREMGGFFRYSTTKDWSIPHFEKMLEDNSKLLVVYLKAYQIFNDNNYKEIALDVIMYLTDWLVNHQSGVFYGSQDADEDYYRKSRTEREQLPEPYRDMTIYTSWNGLAISAFLKAFAVLDALECRDIALKGLEFLLKNCYKSDEGMYHYYLDGEGHNTGLLEDQMAIINALLDAYEVTHTKNYLQQGIHLTDLVIERFYDDRAGGFYVDIPDSAVLKRMTLLEKPLTINSCMAELCLRLQVVTGDADYGQIAEKTLRFCADQYSGYKLFAAAFGSAVSAYIHGFTHITIIGEFGQQSVQKLFQESLKVYSNHKVVEELDPVLDHTRIASLGYDPAQHQAYICRGRKCYPPIQQSEDITRVLAEVKINR